ncbi:MAG: phosphoglycerate dehydrogenase [Bdellovibrionales bacterium]|nr:phosphoglycerate dehydrogenase [Bdellovibrionales bacterium]
MNNLPGKILITDNFTGEAIAQLTAEFGPALVLSQNHRPSPEEREGTEVLLIRSRTQVDKELLAQLPELKLIVTATSGFDHIDLSACVAQGVKVMFTPNANATSVCELTFGLLISLFRHLGAMKKVVNNNLWKDSLGWGRELYGQHLGIFGLGRIGSQVARVAQCFGMTVSAHDPYQADEIFASLGVERMGLSELLLSADIVSLHVPLTKETKHLINHQTLGVINQEAILINTSRGAVMNEIEVIEALELQQLGGLCLDVFEREPLHRSSKLLKLPNVTLSCHIGAYTSAAFQRASLEAVQKVILWSKTGQLSDELPPKCTWYQASNSDVS